MKKFKVVVTRVDEYEVEVDEQIFNEAWKADFQKHFWPIKSLKDVARNLAVHQARFGSITDFIEGYGYVKRDGELPFSFTDYDKDGQELPADKKRQPAEGLNIQIVDEDNDLDTDIEEM